MEGAREYEVVIYRKFIEGGGEVSLIDETTGFVDDYERIDNPTCMISLIWRRIWG